MSSDSDKRLLAFLNMLRQDNKQQPPSVTKNRNVSKQSLNTLSGASNHCQHNHNHQQTQSKQKIYRPCMPHPQLTSLIDEEKLNKGTTWNGLLQEPFKSKDLLSPTSLTSVGTNSNEPATFNQFDPLRTLQFLTLELNSKLKTFLPEQKCIHRITSEIHQAIKRLSCSVASSSSTNSLLQEKVLKKFNMRTQTDCLSKMNKSSQTYIIDNFKIKTQSIVSIDNDNTLNKSSKETINDEYKALEEQCSVLRNEKLSIYNELTEYKEEIVSLKQEIKQLDSKLSATEVIDKTKIETLEKKCQYYENELEIINKASNEKEMQDVKKIDELNCQLKNSIEKFNLLEHKNYENNKKFVLEKLEKEKLLLLLQLRDTHLSDIHSEFKSIQNLVTEQLLAIDNTCIKNENIKVLSPSSSLSEQQQKQLQEELEKKFNINSSFSDIVKKRRNKRKMCSFGTVPVITYTKVQPITATSASSTASSMSTTASQALSLLRKYKNDHKLVLQQQKKDRLAMKEQQPCTDIILNHHSEFGDVSKRKFLTRLSTRKIRTTIKNAGDGDNDAGKVLYKGSEIDEEELDADIMKIDNIKDLPATIDEKIKHDYITFFGSDTNSLDVSQVSIIDGSNN